MAEAATAGQRGPKRASLAETLGILAGVIGPTFAKGLFVRRPRVVALAERLDLDGRAVRRLARLRERHGASLLLPLPGRPTLLLLTVEDARRVLDGAPEPFRPASDEKRAALAHFQPEAVLASRGEARLQRRDLNEAALEPERPVHRHGERFAAVAREEMSVLSGSAGLDWTRWHGLWNRLVRRVVLGDGAAGDETLTELLERLRGDANWAFLKPRRERLRREFQERLEGHLARAEPGSLAAALAAAPKGPKASPAQQVPHWLFAFDAGAVATIRALALLATHPEARARAAAEAARPLAERDHLRACVQESLRLWPTSPAILRQAGAAVPWAGGELPEGTGVILYAPYFHRDPTRVPQADRFAPEAWLERDPPDPGFVPFSGGPAICPGRHVLLLSAAEALAAVLAADGPGRLLSHHLGPERALPGTLDHFALRFGP